ncbi:DEAD/DEAH box helicase family protein [Chitinophaga sp.]|uniref:DEAD/DEAH box helicase n=1 Tax=Chitinophaga sp. TaxID=1869181 RepID=UPI0031D67BE9
MKQLRLYQENAITEVARKIAGGFKKVVFQLATGGGKTVTFAGLVQRYLARNNKKVLILVHRSELLEQAKRTMYDWHEIIAYPVIAGQKWIPNVPVYVGMVETVNNRLKKNPQYFGNVGMVIIDECHIGNFKKIHEYFPDAWIVGFTATPISASKKEPLKDLYEDIVCGIDIPDLVASGSLVQNRTYHIKNINRTDLKIKNGEFDDKVMGQAFSKKKQIDNVVHGYEQHCLNTKSIVFNCSIEHSELVNAAFLKAGYQSRHLDSYAGEEYRKECLAWLRATPNAILNNVGILTTGFDEPSVQSVIVNKSTMSLPLWLQMTGRGSRPYPDKDIFTILDMGGNAMTHGDWCAPRDWKELFYNPDPPSKGDGVAPVKECVQCEAIISASAHICPFCGANNKPAMKVDTTLAEFELLTEQKPLVIEVDRMIQDGQGKHNYAVLHKMKKTIIMTGKHKWHLTSIDNGVADRLREMFQGKVKEWCEKQGEGYTRYYRDMTDKWMLKELKDIFGWEPQPLASTAI